MAVIDATGLILGRMASVVAKRLLLGEEITIVNAEKAVIVGNKEEILERYREKRERGHKYKGPFFPKMPHLIVKRTIRGMLPWKTKRGREAFKRLKVHIGVPEDLKEIAEILETEISLAVNDSLRRLLEISEIERILSKSKLSEERTREISLSLANEYERLYKGLEG